MLSICKNKMYKLFVIHIWLVGTVCHLNHCLLTVGSSMLSGPSQLHSILCIISTCGPCSGSRKKVVILVNMSFMQKVNAH
jgi:hypothetical protein